MTHSEDVKRVANNGTIDFLNARVKALESRVEFLEAQLDVLTEKQLENLNDE
tara:strand:+ start:1257 stop:1412 length:156 start_codon:yes stop_codon:yes gene_type:complete